MHKAQLIWFCEQVLETLTKIKENKIPKEKATKKVVTNVKNIRKTQREVINCVSCKEEIGKELLRAISFFNKAAYILYTRLIKVENNELNFNTIKKCMSRIIRFLDTPDAENKWAETYEVLEFGIHFDVTDEANHMQLTVLELDLSDDMDNLTFLDFITSINQSWASLTR